MPSWKAIVPMLVGLFCFVTSAQGAEVLLQWEGGTESNHFGYSIHYHPGPSAPPYEGSDALEGDSPIVVEAADVTENDICTFRLSGLKDDQTYYFMVTAIGYNGNESNPSNEVCFNCPTGQGGGGGGCVINTVTSSFNS